MYDKHGTAHHRLRCSCCRTLCTCDLVLPAAKVVSHRAHAFLDVDAGYCPEVLVYGKHDGVDEARLEVRPRDGLGAVKDRRDCDATRTLTIALRVELLHDAVCPRLVQLPGLGRLQQHRSEGNGEGGSRAGKVVHGAGVRC